MIGVRLNTFNDNSGEPEQDANSALTELDKGLRSGKVGEQCEAIVRFPRLFEKYPFPILINSSFLKLADVFRMGNNFLRLWVLRVCQQSEKHLDKILNVDEFLRRVFSVLHSNDPVARALALRTLGAVAGIIPERQNVHHAIRRGLDSHDNVEVEAAIYATTRFAAHSNTFAVAMCNKLSDMVECESTGAERRAKLVDLLLSIATNDARSSVRRAALVGLKKLAEHAALWSTESIQGLVLVECPAVFAGAAISPAALRSQQLRGHGWRRGGARPRALLEALAALAGGTHCALAVTLTDLVDGADASPDPSDDGTALVLLCTVIFQERAAKALTCKVNPIWQERVKETIASITGLEAASSAWEVAGGWGGAGAGAAGGGGGCAASCAGCGASQNTFNQLSQFLDRITCTQEQELFLPHAEAVLAAVRACCAGALWPRGVLCARACGALCRLSLTPGARGQEHAATLPSTHHLALKAEGVLLPPRPGRAAATPAQVSDALGTRASTGGGALCRLSLTPGARGQEHAATLPSTHHLALKAEGTVELTNIPPVLTAVQTVTPVRDFFSAQQLVSVATPGLYTVAVEAAFAHEDSSAKGNTQTARVEDSLPSLVYSLDLSSNNMTSVTTSYLYKSSTMKELIFKNNMIAEIEANALLLPELTRLDLSDNALEFIDKEVFKGLKKLQYLNLAENKFTTFEKLAFHHLSNLNEIILDNNNIGPSLKDINLFDRSGFGLTHKIQHLSISGINLKTVPDNFFTEAYDLKRLTISNNGLHDIVEIPFTLEYLDISDNPIEEISSEDFADLPALKELKLNNLAIKEVPDYVFVPLNGLLKLELERNRNLTKFSSLCFGREVLEDADDFALEELSLMGSRVSRLDEKLLQPFGQLARLDLQGNPWVCDCNIVWMQKLQIEKRDQEHLRCGSPRPLFNARIFDLAESSFVCPVNKHYVALTIAGISFCLLLALIALWFFVCLPKYQSRNETLRNMYAPSTAYSVLPMSTSSVPF
ncbi:hypothetical protein MSG28_009503 [Choristoneura fumiferana]|uniref:Uncharacterized protein n=1 Tax=Choristoneura fumiferana TaxID=7141 RepID=A0ACC0JBE5_CHOFU|nr:hypothetical protein MSG28_009503 [Choristoneura fumiferana]